MSGVPDELALPYDRPRRATASREGGTFRFHIDAAVHRALSALARRSKSTMFMVLQAAVAILYSKLGAGDDIPLGTPVAGRTDPALDDLVGLFANLVVLRTDVSGDPTFEQLVARVREVALDAFAHQDTPFELVVDALNPVRSLARHPLFQTVITLDPDELPVRLPGLTVQSCAPGLDVAKYDLHFNFDERRARDGAPAGISALIGYSSELFEAFTIRSFAERLTRILAAVAADGARPLSRMDVLGAAERQRILVQWNDTAMGLPQGSLPALLEAQVARTPTAPAVQMADTILSYADFNARVNQLARHLISRGAGPESIIALMMPRSVEQIVAVWATLKAGAAYLPVDPAYPAERVAFMLRDAAPVLTLTEAIDVSALPSSNLTDAERLSPLRPAHPAYVCYTSGSTGVPKAAAMPCGAMVNLVTWTMAHFPPGRMAQFSSLSFDTSAMEILATTVNGGCLVVPHEGVRRDAEEYVRWLVKHEVNEMLVPNLVVEAMCDAASFMRAALPALRRICQGGEALVLSPRLKELYAANRELRLINHYGPTETHLAVARLFPAAVGDWPAEPPIGRPIANTQAYVLDAHLQPVPAGVIGELYLAGAQVARGYLHRPAFTASRFVANPFGPPGARMYRTGDLVRWREDGELVFAGRVDHQVKIRGFRIELGEIEAVLRGHAEVAQVAVTAVGERRGAERIVAYVVTASAPIDAEALRRHVAAALPDYMVPSAFVQLERMPLNPNGKLDRRALPPPARAESGRPPRTPTEQALCELYAHVLAAQAVTIDDDFFALGGHSLLAAKLISRIRSTLRVEVPIRALFEGPTPAALAERVAAAINASPGALAPKPRPELIPLSSAQLRMWFQHRMEGLSSTYNLPVIVRLSGDIDRGALQAALGDVAARHESLRTVFADRDGQPYQRILDLAPRWTFSRVRACELEERLEAAAAYTFDLATETPLAAWLYEVGPGEHVLLLLMHHIASDGWSLAPLARDLSAAYGARRRGQPPGWPPLRVQYADYTLWQRELPIDAGLSYWTDRLAGSPSELVLPVDRPRPAVPSYRGRRVALRLNQELHRALIALARRSSCTLFMVLHAGLSVSLNELGAGVDIVIGTAVAGRGEETLDELIGFFVNTVVLRADLSGAPTFTELLARVRDGDIAAFGHQLVPFEQVVEALKPERRSGRHPLFQVMLAFNNNEEPSFDLAGLTAKLEYMLRDIARFDLTFNLWETFGANGEAAGVDGYLQYSRDLYDDPTAKAIADRLHRVFTAVAADPGAPVAIGGGPPAISNPSASPPPWREADAAAGGAPRTPLERVLAELFAEVLGVPQVGIHESFFEAGGYSILVLRLVSRVKAALGIELTVRDVFEASTVAGLAQRAGQNPGSDALAVLLPLRQAGLGPALFCVHPAAGTSWVYSGLLRFLDSALPIYGLQARGLREPQRMPRSAEEVVVDYLAEIRAVQPHGPYALLGWSVGGEIAHLLAARLQQEGEEVSLLAVLDSYPSTRALAPGNGERMRPEAIAESIGQDLALAGLGEMESAALVNVVGATRELFWDVSHGVFRGDLLFFRATADKTEDSPYTAELWRPHVTGAIEIHSVECAHGEMTRRRPRAHRSGARREAERAKESNGVDDAHAIPGQAGPRSGEAGKRSGEEPHAPLLGAVHGLLLRAAVEERHAPSTRRRSRRRHHRPLRHDQALRHHRPRRAAPIHQRDHRDVLRCGERDVRAAGGHQRDGDRPASGLPRALRRSAGPKARRAPAARQPVHERGLRVHR